MLKTDSFLFHLKMGDYYMKLSDMLSDDQKKKIESTRKKKEKLKSWELKDLMGINRDTYKRNRGAIRRK